jgi:hypothetical protein
MKCPLRQKNSRGRGSQRIRKAQTVKSARIRQKSKPREFPNPRPFATSPPSSTAAGRHFPLLISRDPAKGNAEGPGSAGGSKWCVPPSTKCCVPHLLVSKVVCPRQIPPSDPPPCPGAISGGLQNAHLTRSREAAKRNAEGPGSAGGSKWCVPPSAKCCVPVSSPPP